MPEDITAAFATASATSRERVNTHVRLSGPIADRPNAKLAIDAYFFATDENKVYESTGSDWERRGNLTKDDYQGRTSGPDANKPFAAKMIGWMYHADDSGIDYEAFPGDKKHENGVWFAALASDFQPDNLSDAVSKLNDSGLAKLRSKLSGQFGVRLESTGARQNPAQTRILVQTLDASPENPYVVEFDQFILEPFTGEGRFDLVERDSIRRSFGGASAGGTPILTDPSGIMNWQSGDVDKIIQVGRNPGRFFRILSRQSVTQVTLSANITTPSTGLTLTMDGEAEVTLADSTKINDGLSATAGWYHFRKVITSDKVYSVNFVPGDTGIGIYSAKVRALVDQTQD